MFPYDCSEYLFFGRNTTEVMLSFSWCTLSEATCCQLVSSLAIITSVLTSFDWAHQTHRPRWQVKNCHSNPISSEWHYLTTQWKGASDSHCTENHYDGNRFHLLIVLISIWNSPFIYSVSEKMTSAHCVSWVPRQGIIHSRCSIRHLGVTAPDYLSPDATEPTSSSSCFQVRFGSSSLQSVPSQHRFTIILGTWHKISHHPWALSYSGCLEWYFPFNCLAKSHSLFKF